MQANTDTAGAGECYELVNFSDASSQEFDSKYERYINIEFFSEPSQENIRIFPLRENLESIECQSEKSLERKYRKYFGLIRK